MQTCCSCWETKPLSEFHKNPDAASGRHSLCKDCKSILNHVLYLRNRDKRRKQTKVYAQTTIGKQVMYEANKRQYIKWPEKIIARVLVYQALKDGTLVKTPCYCGETKVEAHHYAGYDRINRLNVVWLCGPHHRQVEQSMRQM